MKKCIKLGLGIIIYCIALIIFIFLEPAKDIYEPGTFEAIILTLLIFVLLVLIGMKGENK